MPAAPRVTVRTFDLSAVVLVSEGAWLRPGHVIGRRLKTPLADVVQDASRARAYRRRFGTKWKRTGRRRGKTRTRRQGSNDNEEKCRERTPPREGNVEFPTGTLTSDPPEPPSGTLDLYANLLCFGAPGPQKPRILPAGSKSPLPAASGRPPATPGASWGSPGHPPRPGSQSDRENAALRPPRVAGSTCFTAPEQTRVAIGPRKRGTLHGQVACFPKIPRKYRRLPQKIPLPHANRAPRKKK